MIRVHWHIAQLSSQPAMQWQLLSVCFNVLGLHWMHLPLMLSGLWPLGWRCSSHATIAPDVVMRCLFSRFFSNPLLTRNKKSKLVCRIRIVRWQYHHSFTDLRASSDDGFTQFDIYVATQCSLSNLISLYNVNTSYQWCFFFQRSDSGFWDFTGMVLKFQNKFSFVCLSGGTPAHQDPPRLTLGDGFQTCTCTMHLYVLSTEFIWFSHSCKLVFKSWPWLSLQRIEDRPQLDKYKC